MTCGKREKMFATTLLIREKHTRKTPKLYSVFQANAKTNKNITPKMECKLSVRNRQLLMMLWFRTYPTSHMLSAMFGVSKSTYENFITKLTQILFANLKIYIKWPSLREWQNFRGNWEKSPMPAINVRYRRKFS